MNYWYMSAAPFTIFVPFAVALFRSGKLPRYAVALAALLLLGGITHLTITLLAESGVNNLPFFHVYTVLEMLLLIVFFSRLPAFGIAEKLIVGGIGGLFLVFAVLNTLYLQPLHEFNSYARSIEALVVIVFCFVWFARQFQAESLSFREPATWFVTALFVYFAATFLIFLVSNLSLILDKYFDWILWNIHATIILVIHVLYTIGFTRCRV